jgi:uncharacterized protein (DUF934 family)
MTPEGSSPVLHDRVIRGGRVEAEPWRFVGLEGAEAPTAPLPPGPVVVPLACWQAQRDVLLTRRDPVGVWLAPDDEPAALAADLTALALVAVHFPKFTDGRGYSTAALLRTRYGYQGELRAFGDVGRDQLFYLKRCGFDSFALAAHRDPQAALPGLEDFRHRYQGSVDDALPLFRRRHGARPDG